MKALLLSSVGTLETVELADPEPARGEVVVDVAFAGICGSDIHSARDGGLLREPPIVMGHEFSGTVGPRRVTVNPVLSCGRCDLCREGSDHLCRDRTIIGIQRPGGFADRVAVPESSLVDLPDGVSLQAAALVEPLAVALHAIRLCHVDGASRVGVLGAGPIGLLTTFLLAGHAGHVSVADLQAERAAHARRLGATVAASELEGEFDVIFDAVGNPATHRLSLTHLRPRGTAVWIGNESPEAAFDAQVLVRAEQRVLGSAAYTRRDFRDAVAHADDRLLELVEVEPMREGAAVMYSLMEPVPAGPLKVLLRPAPEAPEDDQATAERSRA